MRRIMEGDDSDADDAGIMEFVNMEKSCLLTTVEKEVNGEHSDTDDGDDTSVHGEKRNFFSVDRYMLPVKVAYFFHGTRSMLDAYFLIFFVSLGLSTGDASIIFAFMYIGGVISGPVWGFIADKFLMHRVLALVISTMAAITMCAQPLLGVLFGDKNRFKCPYNATVQSNIHQPNVFASHDELFYSLLFVAAIGLLFDAGIVSFIEAGCLQRIKASPKGGDIGQQKYIQVFGGLTGCFMYSGAIMLYPNSNTSCESGIFVVYFIVMVGIGVSCNYLFKGIPVCKDEKNACGIDWREILHTTLKNYDTLFFILSVLFGGMLHSLFFNFFYLYLKELGAIPLIYGMHGIVLDASAGFVYYFSQSIINKLGGNLNAMCFSCFVYVLRFFGVSLIKNPYYALAIEITNGLSYSLFTVASLKHVYDISEMRVVATMCGIRCCLYFQVNSVIVNFIGGQIYNRYGGVFLFRMSSYLSAGWGVIMLLYILVKRFYKVVYGKFVTRDETDDSDA